MPRRDAALLTALNLARELMENGGSGEDAESRKAAAERVRQLRLDIDSTMARND